MFVLMKILLSLLEGKLSIVSFDQSKRTIDSSHKFNSGNA